MARNKFPPVRKNAQSSSGIARPRSGKPHTLAHPALIHGFLIPLAAASIGAAWEPKLDPADAKARNVRAHGLSGPKHEGPAADATFH